MPNAAIHPTPQELTAFARGKLPDAVAAAVAGHLDKCPECRKAIDSLPSGSILGKVRAVKPDVSSLPARAGNAPNAAAPFAPPKNLPPDLANYAKYRFLRELGRGGMGVVYQAEQTVMGRTVAVKVINPRVLDHPDSLPRFQAEVRAAAKLDHPNIVRAHDAEQVGSMHLLVMEYIEGTSLAELVKKKGPLSVAYACHYIRQAALGLQHAFEQGMVHRDIKPQNLMVNPRGQVKVLDFGLARMRSERKQGCGLTQADTFMGTPEYVAPEQATDARSADTRADIYSLGCTLFFLLTGRPPFQEDTMVKLILAQIEKAPPVLHEVRADVPAELSAVVARMLAKDPSRRFQTPLEVEQALAAFVKPGTKRPAAGVWPPTPGVASPATGTRIAANTSKIKAILGDVTRIAPARDAATGAFDGLEEAAVSSKRKAKPARKAAKPVPAAWWKRPGVLAAAVSVSLALILMAVIIIKVKVPPTNGDTGKALSSKAGTGKQKLPPAEAIVVLEIDQPDAEVTVDGQKISVQVPGDNKPIEIHVQPGRPHKLRVRKDGFEVVSRDVELKSGKSASIRVRLEPVKVAATPKKQPAAPRPVPPTDPRPVPPADGFVSLFNGKVSNLWKAEGDEYIHSFQGKADPLLLGSDDWTDYTLCFQVRLSDGQKGLSVFVRREANGNTWWLKLGESNKFATFWQIGPTTYTMGGAANHAVDGTLESNRWHDVQVEVRANTMKLTVDDKVIYTLRSTLDERSTSHTKGHVGIDSHSSESRWKDLRVISADGRVLWQGQPGKQLPSKTLVESEAFKPLFNGKDLTGWKTHRTQPGNWRVEKGILTGSSAGVSHLYTDRGDYTDFHLRLEARLNVGSGFRSTGVYFRAPFGPNLPANKPTWIAAYNAKIDARRLGGLLIDLNPELHRTREPVLQPGEWLTYEVIAEGNHIVIKANGQTTSDYTDEQRRYTKGYIVLQQHGAATVAEFRKIEIKELPRRKP